ncbi:MAG: glycosyltransferase [Xanthobacteraceae bacterium]
MPDRLTVLLTNIWLTTRAGSETVIRDLALGLLRRGHRPVVYSPSLGAPAEDLIARGIVVIDDLRKLAEPPDILHAHHVIPCGEALHRFPDLPAIQACHAFAYWAEAPAHFPQIAVYVAVDEACRDRLVHSQGIDPNRVVVMHNAVDLTRIPERPQPAAPRPRRAAAFGKAGLSPVPRLACEQLGIEFQVIGTQEQIAQPESELVKVDLVFASARCALESLCCGCAVVVCDPRGMAGLVTSSNLQDLRLKNFGQRSLTGVLSVEACLQEIKRYDPDDAARVSTIARREAELERQLDQFEELYRAILTGPRRPLVTPEEHRRAMAQFLHEYLPRHRDTTRWPWLGAREELLRHVEQLEASLGETRGQLASARQEMGNAHHTLEARLNAVQDERDLARRDLAEARSELQRLNLETEVARQTFAAQLEKTQHEHDEVSRALLESRAAEAENAMVIAEAQARLAQHAALTQQQLEETQLNFSILSGQLADLRRSRMLKLGRVLRRIAGRPISY